MVQKEILGFEAKVVTAFAAAVLMVALLAALTWKNAGDAVKAALEVGHAHRILDAISETNGGLRQVISAARGYAITGDASYLADVDLLVPALKTTLRRLKDLTADNPVQQKNWQQLRKLVDERLVLVERMAQLRKGEGFEAARVFVASGLGRDASNRFGSQLEAMASEERSLLATREQAQVLARKIAVASGVIAVIVLFALFTATYGLIDRQMKVRLQAEAALRAGEEHLATTLDSIGDAVMSTDTVGRITHMNPVAERLTGWPATEARGRPIDEVFRIVNEQTRAPTAVPVTAVLATGEAQGLANHTVLLGRQGTETVIADKATPIRDAVGLVGGVVLVFRDVSAERLAQRTLLEQNAELERRVRKRTARMRASEAQMDNVFEHLDEGVVVCGMDGQLLRVNRAGIEMHEFASLEEYVRHRPDFDKLYEVQDEKGTPLPNDQWPLNRILRGEMLRDLEVIIRRLDSPMTKIRSYSGMLVRDADHQPLFAVATFRDITEKKRAEIAIREVNASLEQRVAERTVQLEAASHAKSDFLANMSHELRTPLNSIIGFSELMKDGMVGELGVKQRGFATDIFDAGSHLLSLINDILDLSKVEAGMLALEPEAVAVSALLKASMLVVREKAAAHRIRLDIRLDAGLGSMLVDERKLKQIIYNLLSNAVKFSVAGGTVCLSARRCTRAEVALDEAMPGRLIALAPSADQEFLVISVEDSGVGIAEADLQKLFEPFTQVDSSVARRHAGTGLGLSLVRRFAEMHGGTVGVGSRPGQGSRFCVWLPWREASPAVQVSVLTHEPAARLEFAPPLALVVEDDDRVAEQISEQLRSEGFEVMRSATAEEGLVRASKHKPDIITLDIFLPMMDGWEFLRRLRVDPLLADTPVVIITDSGDLAHGLALGARRVLNKPFLREDLVAVTAGLVGARPGEERTSVLVADDNVKAVELLATVLEAAGYRVLRAYGGAEAIAVARSAHPDVVILDLMMPGVSGFDVARALRQTEPTAKVPILVLTSKDLSAEERARLNSEVNAILAKSSVSHDELLGQVQRLISGQPAG